MKKILLLSFRKITTIVVVLLVTGCALNPYGGTFKFSGPGDFQAFSKVFYQCVMQSSQRVGGVSFSQVLPSCGALRACLAASDYYQDPNGKIDGEPIAVKCAN